MAWAGLLLFGARQIERTSPITSAEKLWVAALLFAVLPTLAAPTLAAFGISLRTPVVERAYIPGLALESGMVPVRAEEPDSSATLLSPDQISGAASLLYVYGVFLAFFLWAARQAGLKYAVARATVVTDDALLTEIGKWSTRLEVRTPAVRRSRHVSSVCITGVFRQTILIPWGIETRISTEDLVLMCAHELAHVRRGDTRLFTATQLARVLFWFNPLISRIAANAELSAEESADALVLRKGVDRRAYAACFVEGLKFAAYRMNVQPALAPSFTPFDRNGRRRRLNAILSVDTAQTPSGGRRFLAAGAASLVALVALGQAALAVDPESATARRTTLKNLPVDGKVTAEFGDRIRFRDGEEIPSHSGIDISAPKGAKVRAPGPGVVIEATDLYRGSPAWGKVVVIDHGHGLVTRYAHLDSYAVRKGQQVEAGEVIAAVGATGKVTGPHLHFETLKNGEAIDPVEVVAETAPARPAAPVEHSTPAPVAAPAPVSAPEPTFDAQAADKFSFAMAPAAEIPGVPGVRSFGPKEAFPAFAFDTPKIAVAPQIEIAELAFPEMNTFAIAGQTPVTRMAEDIEKQLLGALGGENGGDFEIKFVNGDKVYRFSSKTPMSPADRAELRKAMGEMRGRNDAWREEAVRQRNEWNKELTRERIRRAEKSDRKADVETFLTKEDLLDMQREFHANRREQLEAQREALAEARADLEEAANDSFDDALSDLEDASLPREELAAARARIQTQKRQLQRDSDFHRRIVENERRNIDLQIERIDRSIKKLDEDVTSD
jgi:murein DD-endopeptidase MepM/ murein hydrolase activator NlpD